MAVRQKHTWAVVAALFVLLILRADARGSEVEVSGPGGEAASRHTAPQVQIWSCHGRLHDCHVSQGGKGSNGSPAYSPNKGRAAVMPKFKPRIVVRRGKNRR